MKKISEIIPFFHTSLVVRSASLVLLFSGLVGLVMLSIITRFVEPTIQDSLTKRLGDLVRTVESTTSIACYTGDDKLAEEVAKGLLMSPDVERVLIAGDQGVLVDINRNAVDHPQPKKTQPAIDPLADPLAEVPKAPTPPDSSFPAGTTIRHLVSPFKAGSFIGKIVVLRNQASIDVQVNETMDFIRLLIMIQTSVIILVVIFIAVGYIAQPIHRISKQLGEVSAEDGEKLVTPAGHQTNEIGKLVNNVNALIDRLVRGLVSERELRLQREIEEKRFRAIFENAETGIFVITGHGILKSFNPAFSRSLWLTDETLRSFQEGNDIPLTDHVGEQGMSVRTIIEDCLKERRTKTAELMLIGHNGSGVRWVNMILNPVEDDLIQGVINDVTENKMREAQANKLALTDTLTGMGNRLGFERQIDALIAERKLNPEQCFTLMLIDLDHFKEVNDTLGHDAGDAILISVSRHIEHSIRKADFAARQGGDEFVVLLPFVSDEKIVTRLANSLITNISKPVMTPSGAEARVGASIGVSIVNEPNLKREEIIKRADLALYAVKEAGRNAFRIYDKATMPSSAPKADV